MDAKQVKIEGVIDLEMAAVIDEDKNSLDVEEAMEDDEWRSRRRRMQALVAAAATAASAATAFTPIETVSPLLYKVMVPLMRIVMDQDDADLFIDALEKCFHEHGHSPTTIFRQLSPSNSSLLHVAASSRKGQGNILKLIIDYCPENLVAAQNAKGDTALHVAARAGRVGAAEILIHQKSKLCNNGDLMMMRTKNNLGDTALHDAVFRGHHEVVRWLLSKDSELIYEENNQKKSPLYLAVEKSDLEMISILLTSSAPLETSKLQHMSPAHAAIAYNKLDALQKMSEESPKLLLEVKDAAGGNPLHLAAFEDNVGAVEILLESFPNLAYGSDKDGNLPIHVACKMGHVNTIRKLLWFWPDPAQFINKQGQNILHISAKYGRTKTVKFIIGDSRLEVLINEKDYYGNTPLHLAAMYSQPAALAPLARDRRVELNLLNNECLTGYDVALQRLQTKFSIRERKQVNFTTRQWLVYAIFLSVMLPSNPLNSKDQFICKPDGRDVKPVVKLNEDRVTKTLDTRLIVATLVAGVAFAAGFAVTADKDANLLNNRMFHAFTICNTLAMYSSMFVVVILLWAQLSSVWEAWTAYAYSVVPLAIALITMSVAYMAGVSLVVSKLTWLSAIIFYIGLFFVILITVAYLGLYIPIGPRRLRFLRIMNSIVVDIYVVWLGDAIPLQYREELDTEESSLASASASASQPATESGDKNSIRET